MALESSVVNHYSIDFCSYVRISYDYDPYYCRLTIRMPTPLYETFCAEVVGEISSHVMNYELKGFMTNRRMNRWILFVGRFRLR